MKDFFCTDFTEEDKVPLKHLRNKLISNEDVSKKVQNNLKDSVAEIFDNYRDEELNELLTLM